MLRISVTVRATSRRSTLEYCVTALANGAGIDEADRCHVVVRGGRTDPQQDASAGDRLLVGLPADAQGATRALHHRSPGANSKSGPSSRAIGAMRSSESEGSTYHLPSLGLAAAPVGIVNHHVAHDTD